MVCTKNEIKDIVKDFVKRLGEKIPVEKVIIFGSYAHGNPNRASDLDLAVISARFKRMKDIKRIMLLSDIARYVKTPRLIDLDPLGFTEEELSAAHSFDLSGEIREKGRVVYLRNPSRKYARAGRKPR